MGKSIGLLSLVAGSLFALAAIGMWIVHWPRIEAIGLDALLLAASQASMLCGLVGTWMWMVKGRALGEPIEGYWTFALGPRPNTPEKAILWRWGRFTLGSWIAMMLAILAMVASS